MLFIGIDLAWSERNSSGLAILRGDKKKVEFVFGDVFFSDEDIMKCVREYTKNQDGIIAIDAPLIVPNMTGRRVAEELIGGLFRKYDAGAHPANRKRLSEWGGRVRGEEISKLLIKEGFKHSPYFKKFENTRKFFEVYPHPSMVVLFNLDKILRYKAKPNRDYVFRWNEFKRYQKYLSSLDSLILPKSIVRKEVSGLRGSSLKKYEDLLDSIFCGYLSYYHWKYPEKCRVLGDLKKGYISTPVFGK